MASHILPTADTLHNTFHYDPDTGELRWAVSTTNAAKAGAVAGNVDPSGYIKIRFQYRLLYAHRVIWCMMTGEWPANKIDHKDRNRSNNAWLNLRAASNLDNGRNTSLSIRNTSGYKGVHWDKQRRKWVADIYSNGARRRTFHEKAEDAHAAYCDAATQMHGEFASFG